MCSAVLEMDPNNNAPAAREKCYSLRPRSAVKRSDDEDDEIVTWRRRPKKRTKNKQAPLSKYKRKTANARERTRMREINEAFDSLRRAVPHSVGMNCDAGEKLTKISTLKLAMKYIAALTAALAEPNESDGESFISDSTMTDLCSTSESSVTPPLPPISVLDPSFSDPYSDFSDSTLPPLDPYADFSTFAFDDPFVADFS
ncbi:Helix-loop-helix DNA-Hypothetical protein domain [Nesidiocoris tenuis]|uniref:BHLH domain-containing protein n=2 Tax=Nesidiocoris tenuis TaxID=355587 RepID=A0ABN7BA88_9HEMI|nr:Helix-loop-helix DNA-Hypothetical protein domain [Nesidiocoris tenuis]